jgi:hypothetical protein
MRLIPLRRVSFEITYYSSMQRAIIGDITEMGITPSDLGAIKQHVKHA